MGNVILKSLTRRFELPGGAALTVLDGVSETFAAGESVAVLGPSGTGKSTLLNLLGALDTPTSGEVWLDDTQVTALRGEALAQYRAHRVGFVFQDHHLLPQLSALENVLVPTLAAGRPEPDAEARAAQLLHRVGLDERRQSMPAQLSGGECQRVALARALMNGPELLLCDEPTGNLDADTGRTVMELLTDLSRAQGVTLIVVTHNAGHAAALDRRVELREGRLLPLRDGGPGAAG